MHEVRGKDGVGAKMDSMELEREKASGVQLAQSNRGQFHYHRAELSSQLKSQCGNILVKDVRVIPRSGASTIYGKTLFRLIAIFRMYFGTSLKTSRRDCPAISSPGPLSPVVVVSTIFPYFIRNCIIK
jgi:hypothetical protein